jgi:hypothetical protein
MLKDLRLIKSMSILKRNEVKKWNKMDGLFG